MATVVPGSWHMPSSGSPRPAVAEAPRANDHFVEQTAGDGEAQFIKLNDWLSDEVIRGFLMQFPPHQRVEVARCACRIGVHCLGGWNAGGQPWTLEVLLSTAGGLNPGSPVAANGALGLSSTGTSASTPAAGTEDLDGSSRKTSKSSPERGLRASGGEPANVQRRSRGAENLAAQPWAAPRMAAQDEHVVYKPEMGQYAVAEAPTHPSWCAEPGTVVRTASPVSTEGRATVPEATLRTPPQQLRGTLHQRGTSASRSSQVPTRNGVPLRCAAESKPGATPWSADLRPQDSASSLSEAAARRQCATTKSFVAGGAAAAAARVAARRSGAAAPTVGTRVRAEGRTQAAVTPSRGRTPAAPVAGSRRTLRSPASSTASRDARDGSRGGCADQLRSCAG
ncbi:unnamed protein product, partial [Polarella glacialis]